MSMTGETMSYASEERQAIAQTVMQKIKGYVLRPYLRRIMRCVCIGHVTLILPDGVTICGGHGGTDCEATLVLHRWRAILRLIMGGDLGFAESYIAGDWSTPDLVALLAFGDRNAVAFNGKLDGTYLARFCARLSHVAAKNTRRGSRRNIQAHYDLGNDFYAAWLDTGMSYSSAMFADKNMSLEAAQTAKQNRLLQLLAIQPEMRVLEIGCGWGGLMERVAQQGGHVTGLTLSPAQALYARDRLSTLHVADRAEVRLQDYRDSTGQYDRIVSIEMFEAVGTAYWPVFFDVLQKNLSPDGTALLQVITIDEKRFPAYAQQADFIQKHIFPGGMLPTRAMLAALGRDAGLDIEELDHFGLCYARTLAEWAYRFEQAWPELLALGFNETFKRKWLYYLAYCEAGCRTGTLDVGLYRFKRKVAA